MQEFWTERPIPRQFLSFLLSHSDARFPVLDSLTLALGGTKVIKKWAQKQGVWQLLSITYQDLSSVMWACCCRFKQICRFRRYFILSKDLLVYVRKEGIRLMVSSVTTEKMKYQGRSTYRTYLTLVYVMLQTQPSSQAISRFVVRANWECHDSKEGPAMTEPGTP